MAFAIGALGALAGFVVGYVAVTLILNRIWKERP